jgi:protein SCO1/2
MNKTHFQNKTSKFQKLLIVVVSVLTWNCSAVKEKTLPTLGTLPEFSLTERNGQPFGLQNLRGKIWVADFIFTNCAGTCPIMTTAMTDIQQMALAENLDDVRLVSITVDPERDSLAVLQRFADGYGALKDRWHFLTGEEAAIQQLANKGFFLSAAASTGGSAEEPIIHSNRFVLVDRQGRIRGYYDGTDEESVKLLRKDLKTLYREQAS